MIVKRRKRDVLERRRTIPERMFFAGMFGFLFIWSVCIVFMLGWALVSALKTNLEYINKPLGLPEVLHWENFLIGLEKLQYNGVNWFGMLYNSLWLVIGSTLLSVVMVIITGYIFGQYDFKGKNLIFNIVIFTMTIPLYGSFAANYKLIYDLHLNDSYAYLLTSLGGLGGNMLLTFGYYKALPKALREAVYMDGGSDFKAFVHVYFPLGKNIFIALTLLGFIGGWNNYEVGILYMDKMPPLATGLYAFQQEIIYVANNPAYFAGALLVMVPVLLLFVFFSDKFMGQLFSGGIKG